MQQSMNVSVETLLSYANHFDRGGNIVFRRDSKASAIGDELVEIFHMYNPSEFNTTLECQIVGGPTTKCCATGTCAMPSAGTGGVVC